MKHAPQSRAGGLARTLRPQQRGHDVPCDGALGLRKIDQQRKTLAQVQLDREVVAEDLRKSQRLKREPGHDMSPCPVGARGTQRGRSTDNSRFGLGTPSHFMRTQKDWIMNQFTPPPAPSEVEAFIGQVV